MTELGLSNCNSQKIYDYLHLKDFLRYECELYLNQPLAPSQRKVPTTPQTIDLSMKLDDGQLSLSLEILNYATFDPIVL